MSFDEGINDVRPFFVHFASVMNHSLVCTQRTTRDSLGGGVDVFKPGVNDVTIPLPAPLADGRVVNAVQIDLIGALQVRGRPGNDPVASNAGAAADLLISLPTDLLLQRGIGIERGASDAGSANRGVGDVVVEGPGGHGVHVREDPPGLVDRALDVLGRGTVRAAKRNEAVDVRIVDQHHRVLHE